MNNKIEEIGKVYFFISLGYVAFIFIALTVLNIFDGGWFITDEAWPFLWSLFVSGIFSGLVYVSVPEEETIHA